MAHGTREIEIKLAVHDTATLRRLLRATGFRVSRARLFETNTLFDTPGLRLRTSGSLLRVREVKGAAKLTFKGPATTERFKSREELEVEASDARTLRSILERVGFEPAFRYEKYRTEYRRDAGGVLTWDETPIGVFLELEGSPSWIDRAARRLGFSPADYLTASYWRLYADCCGRQGCPVADMVFRGRKR